MEILLKTFYKNSDVFKSLIDNPFKKLWFYDNGINDWVHYDDLNVSHEIEFGDIITASVDKPTYNPVLGVDIPSLMYPEPLKEWPDSDMINVYVVKVDGVVGVTLQNANDQDKEEYQPYLENGYIHDTIEAAKKHFESLTYLKSIQNKR